MLKDNLDSGLRNKKDIMFLPSSQNSQCATFLVPGEIVAEKMGSFYCHRKEFKDTPNKPSRG